MIFYCVRHGESDYNSEGRIQGQADVGLSDLGRRQALALADALAEHRPDAIYASPLRRALNTAEPVAKRLGMHVETDSRLMELNAGVFQEVLSNELPARFPEAWERWRSQDPDFAIPQGESRRDLMIRGRAVFEDLRARGHDQVAVISHGGLLSAVFKSLLEIPAARNPFTLYNASISILTWDEHIKLLVVNRTDHLERGAVALSRRAGEL